MSIGPRTIHDITAQNRYQVPASRGGNPIQFIVIHYLGVPNADNPNLYGGGYGGHYNITRDGTVYKAADPRTDVVWQCGGGRQGYDPGSAEFFGICTNYNSIGIENGVCYDGTWYFTTETQESLVWLVSTLMDEYGIPIDHVIRHFEVTGKRCPLPYVENTGYKTNWTWDEFKQKLADYRKGGSVDPTVYSFKVKQIKNGSTGKLVRLLQKLLCSRGMYPQKNIDGKFGDNTENAVRKYQKYISTHGGNLAVDGVCGPATWESILGISGNPVIVKQVKPGDKNIYVYLMQELLKAEGYYTGGLDKTFGEKSREALKQYQAKKKLTVDGICGPATFKKLVGI